MVKCVWCYKGQSPITMRVIWCGWKVLKLTQVSPCNSIELPGAMELKIKNTYFLARRNQMIGG